MRPCLQPAEDIESILHSRSLDRPRFWKRSSRLFHLYTQQARSIMSSGDSISKSFGDVLKLLGKENYVKWRQRITSALSLTPLNLVCPPISHHSHSNRHLDRFSIGRSSSSDTDCIDWDHQLAAAILSITDESILTDHIHLLDIDTARAQAVYLELVRIYGNTGAQ